MTSFHLHPPSSIIISARYIDEIIRISNVHQVESRDGKWLLQLLHRVLTLPEEALKENTGNFSMFCNLNVLVLLLMHFWNFCFTMKRTLDIFWSEWLVTKYECRQPCLNADKNSTYYIDF